MCFLSIYLPSRKYRIHYAKSMQRIPIVASNPPESEKEKKKYITTGPGPYCILSVKLT